MSVLNIDTNILVASKIYW